MPEHDHDLRSARVAAEQGELAEWVTSFLSSPGSDNAALAEQLSSPPRAWLGPVLLPIEQLHRLAGPPDEPTLGRFDDDDLDTVESMHESIDEGWDPPPAIVSLRGTQLVVEDGNHRIEGLRRAGEQQCWAVVGSEDPGELADLERLLGAVEGR